MRAVLAAVMLCLRIGAACAETGTASVYGGEHRHNECGRPVASGGVLDCRALTAAHRRLPFGTMVKVCRIGSARRSGAKVAGNCIVVRINDRGPFVRGRIIDLTPAAAHALGFSGLARVTVEPIGWTPRHGDFGSF
jgi:rare lipoprotein A